MPNRSVRHLPAGSAAKKWLAKLFVVGLACAFAALLNPAPAAAAGAEISREIFLAADAGTYGGTVNMLATPRRIYIAAGDYLWEEDVVNVYTASGHIERNIYLAAGYYKWNCQISVWDSDEYWTSCSLTQESSGGIAYLTTIFFRVGADNTYNGIAGDWVTWYSYLTPQ
ncbi:hypothetical protein HDA40_000707 [Hamadaea flava]|uniref:Uncharacterized protein n=1 Tax=Hamadaea flava TaxID=1742688 RepID=A0ABV8M0L8_9ACTN|nr:hypothetical protein [Hamadaea flava]MCP2322200.1 hypothetical protein [Hamadaea flava]